MKSGHHNATYQYHAHRCPSSSQQYSSNSNGRAPPPSSGTQTAGFHESPYSPHMEHHSIALHRTRYIHEHPYLRFPEVAEDAVHTERVGTGAFRASALAAVVLPCRPVFPGCGCAHGAGPFLSRAASRIILRWGVASVVVVALKDVASVPAHSAEFLVSIWIFVIINIMCSRRHGGELICCAP